MCRQVELKNVLLKAENPFKLCLLNINLQSLGLKHCFIYWFSKNNGTYTNGNLIFMMPSGFSLTIIVTTGRFRTTLTSHIPPYETVQFTLLITLIQRHWRLHRHCLMCKCLDNSALYVYPMDSSSSELLFISLTVLLTYNSVKQKIFFAGLGVHLHERLA